MIRKENGKYILYSKDGDKVLGKFDTEKEAQDREAEIERIKRANTAKASVNLIITKAGIGPDGQPRWAITASDTEEDRVGDQTSIALFEDWITRIERSQTVDWLPPPRKPFLGIAHYPDLNGYGEAGITDRAYIDGSQFKAAGVFYLDDSHPLGPDLYNAVADEIALIKRGEAIEKPIRISAAWWDIQHAHGDFLFTRRSLDHVCPMCTKGVGGKRYLKGQLDHFAATRVPINPRTSLALEEKSMTTRKEDAESIVGPGAAEQLEKKTKQLVGKSESGALVIRGGLGAYLKKKRKEMKMSMADAAKAMGMDEEVYKAFEADEETPDDKAMSAIAKAYKVKADDLKKMAMGEDEEKPMKAESSKKKLPWMDEEETDDESDDEEMPEDDKKKTKKSGAVINLSEGTYTLEEIQAIIAKAQNSPLTEKMHGEMMEVYRPFAGATSLEEAEAYIQSQDMMNEVMDNWGMLQAVMGNILSLEPEEGEVDSDLNKRKVEALKSAMAEFSDRVAALKAGLADAYLIYPVSQPESYTGSTGQAQDIIEVPTLEERSQVMTTQNQTPADGAILAKSQVDAIVQNSQLSRDQKLQAMQELLNNTAQALRSEVDRVSPPDVGQQIQKSLAPIAEQLGLIVAKLNQQPQVQPVQKSISQVPPVQIGGAVDGYNGAQVQRSSIQDMARRSVGLNQ